MAEVESEDIGRMTFMEHLGELRDRLVRVAIALVAGFMVAYGFKEQLFNFVAGPIQRTLAQNGIYALRALEITETLFVYLKLSVVGGIVLTLPYTFYQLWAFIAPGLLEKEKRIVTPILFFSTFFFLLGAFFAYSVIVPFIAEYLAQMTQENAAIQMDVTVQSAFSFSLTMLLAFGIAFELPLVMFFLSIIGLVSWRQYLRFYRYFLVISFIVGALLTPPDPLSQVLMAVPLNALYGVGIVAAFFVARRKEQAGSLAIGVSSKVWSALSLALIAIGGAILAVTWWLGRVHSPLRWIPEDAEWVVSVRPDALFGKTPSPDRLAAVRALLGLPVGAPSTDRVILVGGPKGARLAILPGACDAGKSLGTCAEDDLLIGEADYVTSAKSGESRFLERTRIQELELGSPAWAWIARPAPGLLTAVPGPQLEPATVEGLTLAVQLDAAPWVELGVDLKRSEDLTALQTRVEQWRTDAARRAELAEQQRARISGEAELLQLLDDLLALGREELDALARGAEPAALERLRARQAAVQARVTARRRAIGANSSPPTAASSLLDRLGPAGMRNWTTRAADKRMVLRVELTTPAGVDALMAAIPGATSSQTATASSGTSAAR